MGHDSPNVLAHIVAHKREEIRAAKAAVPLDAMRERALAASKPRNFFASVRPPNSRDEARATTAIIAEIKRKSPSAGWIRPEYADETFDPVPIARQYHQAGASAISCLTDSKYFGGKLEYLARVKDAVPLPVLRKDFIVDPYQVYESRAAGADAVLLIAECLREAELVDLLILAQELQLTVLLEVHSMDNLLRVRPHVGFPNASYSLLGINNRDLSTMTTDLSHTIRLVELVDDPAVLVSESGISTHEDLHRLRDAGVHIVLVGESLMREQHPGNALARLLTGGQSGAA